MLKIGEAWCFHYLQNYLWFCALLKISLDRIFSCVAAVWFIPHQPGTPAAGDVKHAFLLAGRIIIIAPSPTDLVGVSGERKSSSEKLRAASRKYRYHLSPCCESQLERCAVALRRIMYRKYAAVTTLLVLAVTLS